MVTPDNSISSADLPLLRPRRNRRSAAIRGLVREYRLSPSQLILPLFVIEGTQRSEAIASLPGCERLSIDRIVAVARKAYDIGIGAVALFPVIAADLKTPRGEESLNDAGLLPRCVRALKEALPELCVITDVALDPYSSDGHDGVIVDGRVDNDETLPLLAAMAVAQARAGADVVAPSDMMDGRVNVIRNALDDAGYSDILICSYCAKYASAFYGPFRDALDSAPKCGDKSTYQMDPANRREALREAELDEQEGADWLMVKPGLPYLDIIADLHEATSLPIAAYHVSGEFAMLKAAAERGWLDYDRCLLESLLALRRAGADMILSYGALDAARLLTSS